MPFNLGQFPPAYGINQELVLISGFALSTQRHETRYFVFSGKLLSLRLIYRINAKTLSSLFVMRVGEVVTRPSYP